MLLVLWAALALDSAVTVVRCDVQGDPQARIYELQRIGEGDDARWRLAMRSRDAGASPVFMPLPGARPSVTATHVALDYRTLNGGRAVRWQVGPSGATLDVHANFELEVNVEVDLDPRVELMNTDGAIAALACDVRPAPRALLRVGIPRGPVPNSKQPQDGAVSVTSRAPSA